LPSLCIRTDQPLGVLLVAPLAHRAVAPSYTTKLPSLPWRTARYRPLFEVRLP
jgi:hypothetical protein